MPHDHKTMGIKKDCVSIKLLQAILPMKKMKLLGLAAATVALSACGIIEEISSSDSDDWTFGQDLAFLKKHDPECLILGQGDSYIAVSPNWQARVLTSTLDGEEGLSLGWYNRLLAMDDKREEEYLNRFGGEERLRIGPEGGDASLFFPAGSLYTAENWRAPSFLSREPWKLVERSATEARFEKLAEVDNAKGAHFKMLLERQVSFIPKADAAKILGIDIPEGVKAVAYQSINKVTNLGPDDWSSKFGMVNISVQSCFTANDTTAVFIPYKPGDMAKFGDILSGEYFVASESQYVVEPNFIKFKVDAKRIEEIGVNAMRSKGILLSFNGKSNVLTVITYLRPASVKGYLPNTWRRNNPKNEGDAISVYNNGPVAQGAFYAMPFYEISTHSPALALARGKSQFHLQRTYHFSGSEYDLGKIAYALTGISMKQIRGEE